MTAPKWVREKGKGNTEKSPNKKEIHLPHIGQSLFLIFQSFQFCLYFVQSIDMFGKFASSISFLSALSPLLFLSTSPFFPPPLGTVLLHGGGDSGWGEGRIKRPFLSSYFTPLSLLLCFGVSLPKGGTFKGPPSPTFQLLHEGFWGLAAICPANWGWPFSPS